MTTLKVKILKSFQHNNRAVVEFHTTNNDIHINELNQGIEDLFLLGIYPRIKEVNNETLNLEFVTENFTQLRVGTLVKFKDEKYLQNPEYKLKNQFFVKRFTKEENSYEVSIAQFIDNEAVEMIIYDSNLKELEGKFQIIG